MSQNFYPGDLRSGQLRDLPIISLWGNTKMLPVSHKPTETTNSFRIMATHAICDDPDATDDREPLGGHLRSSEVK